MTHFLPLGLLSVMIEPKYFLRLDVVHFFEYIKQLLLENLATFITHETLFDETNALLVRFCPNFVHFSPNFPNFLFSTLASLSNPIHVLYSIKNRLGNVWMNLIYAVNNALLYLFAMYVR